MQATTRRVCAAWDALVDVWSFLIQHSLHINILTSHNTEKTMNPVIGIVMFHQYFIFPPSSLFLSCSVLAMWIGRAGCDGSSAAASRFHRADVQSVARRGGSTWSGNLFILYIYSILKFILINGIFLLLRLLCPIFLFQKNGTCIRIARLKWDHCRWTWSSRRRSAPLPRYARTKRSRTDSTGKRLPWPGVLSRRRISKQKTSLPLNENGVICWCVTNLSIEKSSRRDRE